MHKLSTNGTIRDDRRENSTEICSVLFGGILLVIPLLAVAFLLFRVLVATLFDPPPRRRRPSKVLPPATEEGADDDC